LSKDEVLRFLERKGTRRTVDGMARYGIVADRAFGVPMGALIILSKRIGKNHKLADQLWKSGWYEARLLATMVDDPALVTVKQMNEWAASFENWADCDTACFKLFDRSPLAWKRIPPWSKSRHEFVKRGAFALLASLALHDKTARDEQFLALLPAVEKAAQDERDFVMKGVSWALRSIGRRNQALNAASLGIAKRLLETEQPSSRWVGRDAFRELSNAKLRKKLKA
jgi:3-methyladenine DNA glycosylase AlkD